MTVTCPRCSATSPDVLDVLADSRRRYSCNDCGHIWLGAATTPRSTDVYHQARSAFPSPASVDPQRLERVAALKAGFLASNPELPKVQEFWDHYREIFSQDGLPEAAPAEFHYFANVNTGAHPGNMSVFNLEWTAIGPDESARRVREAVEYLLYGPDNTPIEDRLTHLLEPGTEIGMKGWKEALLTKVLCVVQPDRFLPILTYTSPNGGKRELARQIWGLELPDPNRVNWTIGRLIFWSNDLLMELSGDGFAHNTQVSQFLWMAKDRETELAAPS